MNSALTANLAIEGNAEQLVAEKASGTMKRGLDVYFSADVETDGPIPGPFSILSFALVFAGTFDGERFIAPQHYNQTFYRELKPISEEFQGEALRVNGLSRTVNRFWWRILSASTGPGCIGISRGFQPRVLHSITPFASTSRQHSLSKPACKSLRRANRSYFPPFVLKVNTHITLWKMP
jgi:hypothetical protein